MAWFFSKKKKVPKVPFPEGRVMKEGALRFPEEPADQEIKAESLKKAAGLEKFSPPEEPVPSKKIAKAPKILPLLLPKINEVPLYIKMDIYQRILGELDLLKATLNNLSLANKTLEASEYNEEANFDKLRRNMKNLHDRLLEVDKILFKS